MKKTIVVMCIAVFGTTLIQPSDVLMATDDSPTQGRKNPPEAGVSAPDPEKSKKSRARGKGKGKGKKRTHKAQKPKPLAEDEASSSDSEQPPEVEVPAPDPERLAEASSSDSEETKATGKDKGKKSESSSEDESSSSVSEQPPDASSSDSEEPKAKRKNSGKKRKRKVKIPEKSRVLGKEKGKGKKPAPSSGDESSSSDSVDPSLMAFTNLTGNDNIDGTMHANLLYPRVDSTKIGESSVKIEEMATSATTLLSGSTNGLEFEKVAMDKNSLQLVSSNVDSQIEKISQIMMTSKVPFQEVFLPAQTLSSANDVDAQSEKVDRIFARDDSTPRYKKDPEERMKLRQELENFRRMYASKDLG